ncbi:S1C family serine protease [Candidatus Cyanaurora vandensis]|uniref:S1C family serine protease n=1 Tax=Candidatus Cyanaurora vandensis TaxID=2714958 RepID=UPI00257C73EB|nr:trypsin-like peptidase domain-containing protein [Candidatus Cyanaurora vandensis]
MLDQALQAVAARLQTVTVQIETRRGSQGSGVIWGAGLIVTNAHVVPSAGVRVRWQQEVFTAEVQSRAPELDLAVLKIVGLPAITPAVSGDYPLCPGQLVLAVGNPLGVRGAVSWGVVHRAGGRWVQADVRLAPGNSGGPLADAQGRVIGVNSRVLGGLALAIPSPVIQRFLQGPGRRLGVTVQAVQSGSLVLVVEPGSAAARAGLLQGDLLSITPEQLADSLAQAPPNLSLMVNRGGKSLPVIVGFTQAAA